MVVLVASISFPPSSAKKSCKCKNNSTDLEGLPFRKADTSIGSDESGDIQIVAFSQNKAIFDRLKMNLKVSFSVNTSQPYSLFFSKWILSFPTYSLCQH